MDQSQYDGLKKQVAEGLRSSAAQFDKAILTLAAGALALSLSFVRELAPEPDATTICLLACSWTGFIASIVSTLLSFQVSMFAEMHYEKAIDTIHSKPDTDRSNFKSFWKSTTIVLNVFSLVAFVAGTIFLTYSVHDNLKTRGDKMSDSEQRRVQEGAVTPSIPPDEQRGAVVPTPPVAPPIPGTGHLPNTPPSAPPPPPPPPPEE